MQKICFIVVLVFLHACQKKEPPSLLSQALVLAAENRYELEKVLSFYSQDPGDSLKYRAACFLIENMGHHYYYDGEQLEQYQNYYKALHNHKNKSADPVAILDSISMLYGPFSLKNLTPKYDLKELDSAYICNNIEWSFKVWEEQPWGKNISFEDFCEYILPYRIGDEKPTAWKQAFYEKYNHYLVPLSDSTYSGRDDPVVAAKLLMGSIANPDSVYFTMTAPAGYPHVGAQTALYQSGSCRDLTDFAIYACRALGIPSHIDFMIARGDNNADHFWISYTDKSGELHVQDFPGSFRIARQDGLRFDPKAKVYRYTFSVDHHTRNAIMSLDSSAPSFFERPLFKDVTIYSSGYYIQELKIPSSQIYRASTKGKIAYLCLSRQMDWIPVAWASFDINNLSFKNVQKGSVMRVATWENNRLVFQTDPFSMHYLSNEITFFPRTGSLQDVVLYAKFKLDEENIYRDRMLGGVIEASDYPDFRKKDTLYVVNEVPKRLNTSVPVNSVKPYKYLRYYGADGTHCNLSELAFYENVKDTAAVKGKVIGTPGDWQGYGTHEYTNVFDGKTWTSFDYKNGSGGWAGLELEKPVKVGRIVYTPRNRDNYIRPGDTFELFYCDSEWKSLGTIKDENADSLLFKNVPQGALLYLRNHTRGVQERAFVYEGGEQKWK
ncbi:transglutaminase domain-containing protein [uncultured Proteiniphilum sp.]|uniref:transglutaminase domain-containing protein n=1 Tax=uncultured Proteiniphilum sp. TaxID=497637 RepID=UPI0026112A22|nr:transglutaminase domain-containing protein [uncultured Proteiniphilum sp.]